MQIYSFTSLLKTLTWLPSALQKKSKFCSPGKLQALFLPLASPLTTPMLSV